MVWKDPTFFDVSGPRKYYNFVEKMMINHGILRYHTFRQTHAMSCNVNIDCPSHEVHRLLTCVITGYL